jgi:hypothetical protein
MENCQYLYCDPVNFEEMGKVCGGQRGYSLMAPKDRMGQLQDIPNGPFPGEEYQHGWLKLSPYGWAKGPGSEWHHPPGRLKLTPPMGHSKSGFPTEGVGHSK